MDCSLLNIYCIIIVAEPVTAFAAPIPKLFPVMLLKGRSASGSCEYVVETVTQKKFPEVTLFGLLTEVKVTPSVLCVMVNQLVLYVIPASESVLLIALLTGVTVVVEGNIAARHPSRAAETNAWRMYMYWPKSTIPKLRNSNTCKAKTVSITAVPDRLRRMPRTGRAGDR
jgi:hypothetical protein